MSRSAWAAAGATTLALALTPGAALAAGPSHPAAHPATTRATHRHHGLRRRVAAVLTPRQSAASRRHRGVVLAPGAGDKQPTGSRLVRQLQRRLTGLGFSPGRVDGRYGPLTTQAVIRFQTAAGLSSDGITGPDTQAALTAAAHGMLAPGAGYHHPTGSRRVRGLQRRLTRLGFFPGPVDGRYGPLTTHAVIQFQHAHHLTPTGVITPHTLRVLQTAGPAPTRGTHPVSHPTPAQPPAVPQTQPTVQPHRPGHLPALPVTLVLAALAALGVATTALSYSRTRARAHHILTPLQTQSSRPSQTAAGNPSKPPGAPPPSPGHSRSELIKHGGPQR